ncbi:MAG: PAS domain-containing protein [Pirellulales bacterium]
MSGPDMVRSAAPRVPAVDNVHWDADHGSIVDCEDAERLRYVLDAAMDGIWDWDICSGYVYYSPQWCRLLGYEPDEVPNTVQFFLSGVAS